MLSLLMDFLFSPRCPNCHIYVEQRGVFCDACARRLTGLRVIARPADAAPYIAGIRALGHYREGVRNLLRDLKYRREKSVLPYLRGMLAAGEDVLARLPLPLVAVPVPLAPRRARERGFNQAALIFAPWLAAHGISMESLLIRSRETAPLYAFSKEERQRELRGAFARAEGARVEGRNVLLVDDIMTTGTTLIECARTLKRAGAASVYAIVLASEHD